MDDLELLDSDPIAFADEDGKVALPAILNAVRSSPRMPSGLADLLDPESWRQPPPMAWLEERGMFAFHESELRMFLSICGRDSPHFDKVDAMLKRAVAKQEQIEYEHLSWFVRGPFTFFYSFALPSRETLQAITEHTTRIVEVGAGSGFWASQLAMAGADVVATDIYEPGEYAVRTPWHPVERLDAVEATRQHPDRDVLMVWPPQGADWPLEIARNLAPGRLIIFIGEATEYMSASAGFYDLVGSDAFEEVAAERPARFPGINDRLLIFRKV